MDEFTKNLFDYLDKSWEARTTLDALDYALVALADARDALPPDTRGMDARAQADEAMRTIDNAMYEVNRSIYLGELTA